MLSGGTVMVAMAMVAVVAMPFLSKGNNGIPIVLKFPLSVWEIYDWMVEKVSNIWAASTFKSYLLLRGNLSMQSCCHGNNCDMLLVATTCNRLGWDSFVERRVTTLWIHMVTPFLARTSLHLLAKTWVQHFITKLHNVIHKQWVFRIFFPSFPQP